MKTRKNSFLMAALAAVATITIACSKYDKSVENTRQRETMTVILRGMVNAKSATTRSVDADGHTAWVAGEKIAVYYQKTGGTWATAEAEVGTPNVDGSAPITATLTDPKACTVKLVYPASLATDGEINTTRLLNNQLGTIADISANYDAATGSADITVSGSEAAIPGFTLTNQLCIVKFTLTDNSSTPLDVTSFVIDDGTNTYTVTPAIAASAISVAMLPATSAPFTFTATTAGGNFQKSVASATLAAGKIYTQTLKLAAAATPSPAAMPLTLECATAGTLKKGNTSKTVYYTLNGGAKTVFTTAGVAMTAGDKLCLYGDNAAYYSAWNDNEMFDSSYGTGSTGTYYIYGNIMSLINSSSFSTLTTLSADATFEYLFWNDRFLLSHPSNELVLPATTLTENCYLRMFDSCSGLTVAPELPAMTMAPWCYYMMFQNCSGLTAAPELPATTLDEYCYASMFYMCDNMVTPPSILPATTLAESCYREMFSDCSSLVSTPRLPATSLEYDCYYNMFSNCYSLKTAYIRAGYDVYWIDPNNPAERIYDDPDDPYYHEHGNTRGIFHGVSDDYGCTIYTDGDWSHCDDISGWNIETYPE